MPRLAWIQYVDENSPVDPGYGGGIGASHPSQGLPGVPVYPSQGLPGGGHISLLPVFPFDPTLKPDNSLPGGGQIDNSLPIVPGRRFIVKWLCGAGMILVPDNSLPQTPEPK